MIVALVARYTPEGHISVQDPQDGGTADLGYYDADGGTWEDEVTAVLTRHGYTRGTDWDTDEGDDISRALVVRSEEARPTSYTLAYEDAPGSVRSGSEYGDPAELATHLQILATSDDRYTRDHLPVAVVRCYVWAKTPYGQGPLLVRTCTVAEWQQQQS